MCLVHLTVERPLVTRKQVNDDRTGGRRTVDDGARAQRDSRVRFAEDGPTTSGNSQGMRTAMSMGC
jgi:hypothetical protein